MATFYGTFGLATNLRNNYVKIEVEDYDKARDVMFENYGGRWAFLYAEEEFKGQSGKYGLTEVELGTSVNER